MSDQPTITGIVVRINGMYYVIAGNRILVILNPFALRWVPQPQLEIACQVQVLLFGASCRITQVNSTTLVDDITEYIFDNE